MTFEEKSQRKEMLRSLFKDGKIKPMGFKELAGFLGVPKEERGDLNALLDELTNEGLITKDLSGKYGLSSARVITGSFIANERGFGFVDVDGETEDIFIPEKYTYGALHGDIVRVKLRSEGFDDDKGGKHRREGEIVAIEDHGIKQIVGVVQKKKDFCFVVPDNNKINFDVFVDNKNSKSATSGMKVVCELINYGDKNHNPEGKITEIIGNINDPGVDIMSVVLDMGIPHEFPEDVKAYVENGNFIDPDPAEFAGRTDIRNLRTVTIDGEDAKDLDDAITLEKSEDGIYHLGVHIADVSNYVKEGSALDKEAINRGTSCYLTDRVIPMLPPQLSNGICSLNAGTDRLALSCFMDINSEGKIIDHSIKETVVNVDRRMSYTDVFAILERNNEETLEKYRDFIDFFDLMAELSAIIRKRRNERGSIDFDLPECKIELDEKGFVTNIKPYERNTATKIIEDFMLAANETVAEEFFWQELPFVYRVHEEPDEEKMETLREFVKNFGHRLHIRNEVHSKEIQKLLCEIEGTEEEAIISRLTLRSMKQARYSTECTGHFGLASKYYCHFTSPIRRYPDLQIHRIIKEYLHGTLNDRMNHYNEILPDIAARCSKTERRAEEAERETDKMKKAEYMKGFIGQSFTGVISGITSWGIYVELPNTCEGMIRFADIEDDYFECDKTMYMAKSRRTGKEYRLGESVKIVVINADKQTKTVDFMFDYEE
ncbi:MAG: ribonuclease R [Lachnospiraceae bacterium]|nr:ribonuclease R [Lachnospiraceae bacterium]